MYLTNESPTPVRRDAPGVNGHGRRLHRPLWLARARSVISVISVGFAEPPPTPTGRSGSTLAAPGLRADHRPPARFSAAPVVTGRTNMVRPLPVPPVGPAAAFAADRAALLTLHA